MSYVPQAIMQVGFDRTLGLEYPRDHKLIARLTLSEKVAWYAAQDPQKLVQANADFHSFWYWHYILPLKVKRFFYSFKFW